MVAGDTFTFRAPNLNLDTITVGGNPGSTQLEILGGRLNDQTGAFSVDQLPGVLNGVPQQGTFGGVPDVNGPGIQPDPQNLPMLPGGPNPLITTRNPYYADTVFQVFVAKSDASSTIGFEERDINTGALLGYTGNIGVLRMTNRGTVPAPANTGTMLLGSRTITLVTTTNAQAPVVQPPINVPITSGFAAPNLFTLEPAGGLITAGVVVTAGNDFGNFVFGGTVLGTANFGGSVNNFYAGWLLFGRIWNGGEGFAVAGNVQSIISKGGIGTDDASLENPNLLNTGFDLHVGGRLGMVRTSGDYLGTAAVTNASIVPGTAALNPGPVTEVETRGGDATLSGQIGDDPSSRNDTFNTPEILPVTAAGVASVNGSIAILPPTPLDFVDYYGVALLAGQTITVQLQTGQPPQPLNVGVFDPDGVEVATDYNAVDSTFTNQQPFQYTATKPGLYRFAVAVTGNTTFQDGQGPSPAGPFTYNLTVSNIGNVSFGGVLANGIVRDIGSGVGFSASRGDIGTVMAITGIFESQDADTFVVTNGNLRAAQGTSLDNGIGNRSITAAITTGSIGLLSATGGTLTFATDPFVPLGANVQTISAASSALLTIQADGSIGVIRAADMASGPSLLHCNFLNNPNLPATIDLIDVTGDFGALGPGGPQIIMGPGGNVRFIHVGGTVYRDTFFGGSSAVEPTQFQVGEAAQIVDDSGTVVTLTPSAGQTNVNTPGQFIVTPGQLTVTTYGIEGSGGSVITNVTSTAGLTITSAGNTPNQTAEVSSIVTTGTGTALIAGGAATVPGTGGSTTGTTTTPPGANGGNGTGGGLTGNTIPIGGQGPGTGTNNGGSPSIGGGGVGGSVNFPAPGTPGGAPIKTTSTTGSNFKVVPLLAAPGFAATGQALDIVVNGNARVDVYSVNGGNITSLENQTTGGEIVNVEATSVGVLSSNGSIGLDPGKLGESVDGQTIFNNTYPFVQQHFGLHVASGIGALSAPHFGNIFEGSMAGLITVGALGIGSLTGENDGPVITGGGINKVSLSGMAWAGSGAPGASGLYASNTIGPITSSGDVRGNIVSNVGTQSLAVGNNASIINGQILTLADFSGSSAVSTGRLTVDVTTPITNPIHDIGSVTVSGNGGLIGSEIAGLHIGTVSIGGFGSFDSVIRMEFGDNTLDTYQSAGYGMRFGFVIGGATAHNIVAVGNGSNVPTSNFAADVRQSEGGGMFDPHTGLIFSPLNDIDVTLGVTATQPQSQNVTDTGIMEDFVIEGSRDVGVISAYSIRSRPLVIGGVTYNLISTFNIANTIGTLQTAGGINGLTLTVGRVNIFRSNGDTANFNGTFAGAINNLIFNSSLDSSSVINAIGPNGHINNLIVKGNLAGTVTSRTFIQNIQVSGSITGTITATRIGTVHVHAGLGNGDLTINGPITNLIFDGNGGNTGDTITINGNSNMVKVGRDLAASLVVTGKLNQLLVGGNILSGSNSTIAGALTLLKVAGDIQAGASVKAALIKRQMIKGQLLGNLIVG
jgi:hypothetical protein